MESPSKEMILPKRKKSVEADLHDWQLKNPLRRWREERPPEGWNRSLLARQLEVSHTAVASWENGTRLPMVDTFAKIEALTGIRTAQWMEWFNNKPREGN
jgi:ribosome-binding protein aMBF1 (putative translation factor)